MDFRGPYDNMDFYYCVKIKTPGFSTCGGFGGENEFILLGGSPPPTVLLPGIIYKDRKTGDINRSLIL